MSRAHPFWYGFVLHWSEQMWVYRPDEYLFSLNGREHHKRRP